MSSWVTLYPLRSFLFHSAGAYAATTMYLDAVATNPRRMTNAAPMMKAAQATSGGPNALYNRWKYKESFVTRDGLTAEDLQHLQPEAMASLTQDLERFVQENEAAALVALVAVASAGGWSALLGMGAAFTFDGPAGITRYQMVKRVLLN